FAPEVDARAMPGPPTGNEATERKRAAHRRENEASVIASDLKAEEVHGNLFLRVPCNTAREVPAPRAHLLSPFFQLQRQDEWNGPTARSDDLRTPTFPVQGCRRLKLAGVTIDAAGGFDFGAHGTGVGLAAQLGRFGFRARLSELRSGLTLRSRILRVGLTPCLDDDRLGLNPGAFAVLLGLHALRPCQGGAVHGFFVLRRKIQDWNLHVLHLDPEQAFELRRDGHLDVIDDLLAALTSERRDVLAADDRADAIVCNRFKVVGDVDVACATD